MSSVMDAFLKNMDKLMSSTPLFKKEVFQIFVGPLVLNLDVGVLNISIILSNLISGTQ